MSEAEELEVSVSAVVEAEEVDDPLVPVGEDELENLEPENEGVVFVITTGNSRRQSRKSNKTNQSESRIVARGVRGKIGASPQTGAPFTNVASHAVVVHENRSPKKSVSVPRRRRHLSANEREEQERIDRENRILLRKILEQHHGLRRSSSIPPSHPPRRSVDVDNKKKINLKSKPTSNQINEQRRRQKVDYENLLLLQKIQNAKPSRQIERSFNYVR